MIWPLPNFSARSQGGEGNVAVGAVLRSLHLVLRAAGQFWSFHQQVRDCLGTWWHVGHHPLDPSQLSINEALLTDEHTSDACFTTRLGLSAF